MSEHTHLKQVRITFPLSHTHPYSERTHMHTHIFIFTGSVSDELLFFSERLRQRVHRDVWYEKNYVFLEHRSMSTCSCRTPKCIRSWLIITTRFLMQVLDVNEMPSCVGRWLDSVILNCLGPKSITSVLSELRSRKLLVIHALTSFRQASFFGSFTISSGFVGR